MFTANDQHRGITMNHGKADLAIGDGAKTGVATATAIASFSIDGIAYKRAAAATNLPFTAATAQGLLTKCLYLVCSDSAGTITTVKGTAVLTADLVAGTKVLQWPAPLSTTCVIGAVKITTASTANFTPGTTALDATNVTATYYDLCDIPAAPLTA
jgi:hypothetical protein